MGVLVTKSPIDIIKGRIVDIDEHGILTIKAVYNDWPTLIKRQYKDCNIQLIDGRPLSDKQRRTCYALIRDIANYSGMGLDPTKEFLKIKFVTEELQETADQMFSLSSAPMSLVCAFQKFLIEFILDWDIPCSIPLLYFADDIQSYVYACLMSKKCCVCGKQADLHHVDHIGSGRDRTELVHEGMEVLPLCREHHTEAHAIGQITFNQKYHLTKGVIMDKKLCRHYGLKSRKGSQDDE